MDSLPSMRRKRREIRVNDQLKRAIEFEKALAAVEKARRECRERIARHESRARVISWIGGIFILALIILSAVL